MTSVDESKRDFWQKAQVARERAERRVAVKRTLKGGGGGGTSDDMVSLKEYVDARDDAVESRLVQQLDKLSTKGTIWTAVATGVGITLALLAFAGDRFDSGMSVSPAFQNAAMTQASTDKRQDATINAMNAKLDVLVERTAPENARQTSERLRGEPNQN